MWERGQRRGDPAFGAIHGDGHAQAAKRRWKAALPVTCPSCVDDMRAVSRGCARARCTHRFGPTDWADLSWIVAERRARGVCQVRGPLPAHRLPDLIR
jgi:hypothetical protein